MRGREISEEIRRRLWDMEDSAYKSFNSRLIPTMDSEKMIGVRMPRIRSLARELYKDRPADVMLYLDCLPHKYFEENNLHGYLIEQIKDYEEAIARTEMFLPYVDNWATCDTFSPKIFRKNKKDLYSRILKWLKSDHTYMIRYGIGMLLTHFLEEDFAGEHLELVSSIPSEEYYVKMMVAWYLSMALAKQYESALTVLEGGNLDLFTHNKAIQKAIESRQISKERKEYLKTLRRR